MNLEDCVQNNKTRLLYVLYSDKTGVFDQPERTQGPTIIIINGYVGTKKLTFSLVLQCEPAHRQ